MSQRIIKINDEERAIDNIDDWMVALALTAHAAATGTASYDESDRISTQLYQLEALADDWLQSSDARAAQLDLLESVRALVEQAEYNQRYQSLAGKAS